jgi:hypothetical protein
MSAPKVKSGTPPAASRTFDDPVPLPDGSELRILRDAGNFIAGLAKREHDTFAWRAAIEALMLVAEHGGDTMLPRIGHSLVRFVGLSA